MAKDRKGSKWTKDEDRQLTDLFKNYNTYEQMGRKLGRTWFACKCRLARLQLIPPFDKTGEEHFIGSMEKYQVPNQIKPEIETCIGGGIIVQVCDKCCEDEDTSNTFSNAELNVVTDYLKTRLAKVVCKLADGEHCFVRNVELNTAKEIIENEIRVANNMKKITVQERENVLKRLC